MIKTYTYNELRGKIVSKYRTMQAFAEAAGVSNATLSNKMTGKVEIGQHEMDIWASLLGIPKQEYGKYFFT